ncbi:MAG: carbon-nitrogen hydrolase family protein [Pseudomonadota bacterium]
MKLALVQMCGGRAAARNLADAEAMIREAAGAGASVIATPEVTNIVERDADRVMALLKSEAEDPAPARFSALASELGVDLLAGSFALLGEDGRAVNRSMLFGPDGAVKARYDKIHMFDVELGASERYRESATYQPGERAVLTEAAGAPLGLTICYDVRFAALYRRLAQAGAAMITVPAAFTRPTGRAHWEVLLRARAIETGSFILAPAQGGRHEDGRNTWGRSMVIGPWGDVIAALDHDAPALVYAELDLSQVERARSRIPALGPDRAFKGP